MKTKNSGGCYWQLQSYNDTHKIIMFSEVKAWGCKRAKESHSRSSLAEILQRRDRGLVCYDKCLGRELEVFLKARQVCPQRPARKTADAHRLAMIKALEQDDEAQKFERFLELPAELRKRIYELYFAEFKEVLRTPSKPPLARTCWQMRQEVLPLFFSSHEFEIHLVLQQGSHTTFREDDLTHLFFLHLSPSDAANITTLRLVINDELETFGRLHKGFNATYRIALDEAGQSCKLETDTEPSYEATVKWEMQKSAWEREFHKLLAGLETVGERKRFKLKDLHALRSAVEAGFLR